MLNELYSKEECEAFAKHLSQHLRARAGNHHDEFAAIALASPDEYRKLIGTIMFGTSIVMLTDPDSDYSAIRGVCDVARRDLVRVGIHTMIEDRGFMSPDCDPLVVRANADRFIGMIEGVCA